MRDNTAVRILGAELNRINAEANTNNHQSTSPIDLPSGVPATTVLLAGTLVGMEAIGTTDQYYRLETVDTEPVSVCYHHQDSVRTDVQDITPPAHVAVHGTITLLDTADNPRAIIHPTRIAEINETVRDQHRIAIVKQTLDRLETHDVTEAVVEHLRAAAIEELHRVTGENTEQADPGEAGTPAVTEMTAVPDDPSAMVRTVGIDAIADRQQISIDELVALDGIGETHPVPDVNGADGADPDTAPTNECPGVPPAADPTVLDDIDHTTAERLADAGIDTVGQLRDATFETLTSVDGISDPEVQQLGARGVIHNYLTQSLLDKHDESTLRRLAQSAGVDPSASRKQIADSFVRTHARPGRKYPPLW